MVSINLKTLEEISQVCIEYYPNECCGILGGKINRDKKEVLEFYTTENIFKERLKDRYEISPEDFLRIDKLLRDKALDVIGFFHSHPDHPPIPSIFDKERAWHSYIYMIVSVKSGARSVTKVWILNDESGNFSEESLEIK